ncbi:type VI secretion system lipoprotein TssJ [Neptunicoccus sediminis]|uniref:type VI secretion system lipoprotein TssJ n=1 Tax=Neptunicoccus sediminis TaxID=1892596 RepID=UPI000845FB44|nr:type VI secretion system lipoprotein TssJ [Neptunicoccus sediminis]
MLAKLRLAGLSVAALAVMTACAPTPTQVAMNVTASAGVNGGLPVKATIYYLNSTAKFNGTDYASLTATPSAVLGADFVRKESVLLSPGQTKNVSAAFEGEGPAAIGVAVGFKEISTAKWRATTPLVAGKVNTLTISLGANSVNISK